ncbi:MAG TPA: S41 family peptidase, partial [Gemmatimonadaceae bacterium]|nr:S41 family peptidase [Gemmatimonadaceae bacterium]
DWSAVRTRLRPHAERARSIGELRGAVRAMLATLGQSHFTLFTRGLPTRDPLGDARAADSVADVGLDVRLIGDSLVVMRVEPVGGARDAGVRCGWILERIDTLSLKVFVEALHAEESRLSVELRARNRTLRLLGGPPGTTVGLTLRDGTGTAHPLTVQRRRTAGIAVRFGNLPLVHARLEHSQRRTPHGSTAQLLRFNTWMFPLMPGIDSALDAASADGIVIDLRGNAGGVREMIIGLARHFVDTTVTLGTMRFRHADVPNVATPRRTTNDGRPARVQRGPLAILVDELSGSASENFAGSMQAIGRARVFGVRTAGGVLPAATTPLPNGDVLMHAVADFLTAAGTRLEGRGVIPDEVVPLRREDLLAGRDAVLEAALRWIDVARPQR